MCEVARFTVAATFIFLNLLVAAQAQVTTVRPDLFGGGYTASGPDGITHIRPDLLNDGYTVSGPNGITHIRECLWFGVLQSLDPSAAGERLRGDDPFSGRSTSAESMPRFLNPNISPIR